MERRDIGGRDDLEVVLRRFYGAAFADLLIGPYFTDIAGTDLEVHIPRITDFWESALFRSAHYRGNAFVPHAKLHAAAPLRAEHFGRWLQLWRATVDGLHAGPNAERAKLTGERIARGMFRRFTGASVSSIGDGQGFVPLAAVTLRAA